MTQFEKLDLLLRECGGTIQTFQVLNNGISKSVFYAYVKERGLEQASHGVDVSPDTVWQYNIIQALTEWHIWMVFFPVLKDRLSVILRLY